MILNSFPLLSQTECTDNIPVYTFIFSKQNTW